MKTIWTSIGGASVLCCLAAFLFTAEAEMQNTTFLTEAAQGSMAEVMASNTALTRAQSPDVRQFAQQMVTEHTAANQELTTLAASEGVTIPAAVSDKQQRDMEKLNGRTGADFDREYMKKMVNDHERMVKLFEREAERGTDAEVKAFAARMLPSLQSHLAMARTTYDTVRGGNRGNASENNRGGNTNSSDVNQSTNRRQDTNRTTNTGNTNTNTNTGRNTNGSTNTNGNTNGNTNRNDNGNTNTNRNTNGNTNGNTNNTNVNNTMMKHN